MTFVSARLLGHALTLAAGMRGNIGNYVQGSNSRPVESCRQASTTERGVGIAYTGTVENDDYRMSVKLPLGLSGWGGVDSSAPFHGFVVFLDSAEHACVLLEIHLRVNDAGGPMRPEATKAVPISGARAWQVRTVGTLNGIAMSNVRTIFTYEHGAQAYEGTLLLITPVASERQSARVYASILRSLTFE